MGSVMIRRSGDHLVADRDARLGIFELRLLCPIESGLEDGVRQLLETLVTYQRESGRRISVGETVGYGYWLLRAEAIRDAAQAIELWERTPDGLAWAPGAKITLTFWTEQHAICSEASAPFVPPEPDRLVALSPDVLTGAMPIVGARYRMGEKMTGWIINSAGYTGDISTLRMEHMYHLTYVRPDLARFIALPIGYRFRHFAGRHDVFKDPAIPESAQP